jgi:hypothetical protein
MNDDELELMKRSNYRLMLKEEGEREYKMFQTSETNRVNIKQANKDIQTLISLNKQQIATFQNYHRQFISLSAFLVACIIALLLNV